MHAYIKHNNKPPSTCDSDAVARCRCAVDCPYPTFGSLSLRDHAGAFTVVTTVCSAEAWYENAPADPTEDCTAASGTMMPNLLAYDPAAQDGVWYCRKPGVTINAFRVEHCALDCEEATFRKTRCCVASAGEKCLSTEVYPSDSSCAAAEPTCPL